MRKAKLVWKDCGYKVDFCNWIGYSPYKDSDLIAHDLFEHTPEHTGLDTDEIKAIGAKLAIVDTCIYYEGGPVGTVFTDTVSYYRTYQRPEFDKTLKKFKKGKNSIPGMAKCLKDYGSIWKETFLRKLLREGFANGSNFTPKAYTKVLNTDFKAYHRRNVHLEISLITGKVLKETPVK